MSEKDERLGITLAFESGYLRPTLVQGEPVTFSPFVCIFASSERSSVE